MQRGEAGRDAVDGRPTGPSLRRRALLGGLAGLGTAGLAGCSGGGNDGGDGTQTFTTYMERLPQQFSWHTERVAGTWPRLVWPFCFDRLASRRPDGTVESLAAADWRHDDGTIEVEMDPAAGWSDGSPVLGADWAMTVRVRRYRADRSPGAVVDAGNPDSVMEATTDVEWDGRTARLRSEPGFYADFDVDGWLESQLTEPGSGDLYRHRDALGGVLEALDAIEDPYGEAGAEDVAEVLGPAEPDSRTDPTGVVTSGAYRVAEEQSGSVVLEPNPNFRGAEELGVRRVRVRSSSSVRARYGEFKNGFLDALPGNGRPPPRTVIDSFPDGAASYRWGADSWRALHVNGAANPHLSPTAVRQAILYALDREQIAAVAHPQATAAPAEPPGLLHASAGRFVDAALADSFTTYEQDQDRALSLFDSAGFTGGRDALYTPDGDRFSLELLVSAEVIGPADSIGSQLDVLATQLGEVGVDVTVRRLSDTIFANRVSDGEFELATRPWADSPGRLYVDAMRNDIERDMLGVFSEGEIATWVDAHEGVRRVEFPWTSRIEGFTPEQTRTFTVSAPPLGEPESDQRVDYPVVYMGLMLERSLDEATRREYVQKLAWAFNWTLPILPLLQTYNLAFLHTDEWAAPTDPDAWARADPLFYHVAEGNVAPRTEP